MALIGCGAIVYKLKKTICLNLLFSGAIIRTIFGTGAES
jgi:hypothetical protein